MLDQGRAVERDYAGILAAERRAEREAGDALIRALQSGRGAGLDEAYDALNMTAGWRPAMRRCAREVLPTKAAKRAMLRLWLYCGDTIRDGVGDDFLLLDALWKILPPYVGDAVELYRGDSMRNRQRRTYGMSWTSSREVAGAFAQGWWQTFRGGSVLLRAKVPASAVICAPAMIGDRYREAEFLVDRRRLAQVGVVQRFEQREVAR